MVTEEPVVKRIIWKYNPSLFPYLRQSVHIINKTKGTIHGWSGNRYRWVRTLEELQYYANHFEVTVARGVENVQEIRFLMVGYEEVEKDGSGIYFRKYYWLKSYDRYVLPNGLYKDRMPAEATTIFVEAPIPEQKEKVLIAELV